MLFENDHNLIDTEIMKIEQEIEKITDMKSNLYQISSLDEFKNFRGNLGQFLFKFEEEISTIIYSLKSIQNINRKFYDNYAKNQNDFEDVLKQLEYYSNDNKMLINNLNLANKNIDYLNKINLNQEKYIEELIAKLQGKEIEYYGGIITKKKNINDNNNTNNSRLNISEESNKLNFDYDNEKNMIQNKIFKDNNNNDNNNNNNKTLPDYMTNFINNKKKLLNNNLEDNKSEDINNNNNNNNINKSDNISNINNTNSGINISNKESDNNTINQNINNLKLLENKLISNNNNNNNLLNEDKPDVLKYDKVWELFNKNKQNNINNEEENENKEKIDRIQDIVLKIFQNDEMMKYFKEKYGNEFENDILNEKVTNEFLKEIENEINNYELNNKNILNELKSNEEKKNISIPERDLNDDLPTAKFKNKQNSNDILSFNSNNSNNKKIEEESKFKNYFIFNLQREKMFQAQKERKKKNNY